MHVYFLRVIMPATLLAWALAHTAILGGEIKNDKPVKNLGDQPTGIRIRQLLDQPITLDFSGQSVQEALQHLREKTGIEFTVDQNGIALMGMNVNENGDQPITLKCNGAKLGSVLRKMLGTYQLTPVIFEDSVLVTATELAASRQMRQRVNVDVNDEPLAKAARRLAHRYAFNLLIDPKVARQADTCVSLTLDGTSLETSVRLLAELAGLKAVRMDNVLFVTSEERAEKIRKEEKETPRSPLEELNMPGPGPRGGAAFRRSAYPAPVAQVPTAFYDDLSAALTPGGCNVCGRSPSATAYATARR